MKDKHMSAKNRSNRSKNRSNRSKKNNRFIPKQEQRVDKELLQEVSVLLSINKDIDDKTICKMYKITDRQLQYIKDHKQNWDIWESLTGKELK